MTAIRPDRVTRVEFGVAKRVRGERPLLLHKKYSLTRQQVLDLLCVIQKADMAMMNGKASLVLSEDGKEMPTALESFRSAADALTRSLGLGESRWVRTYSMPHSDGEYTMYDEGEDPKTLAAVEALMSARKILEAAADKNEGK